MIENKLLANKITTFDKLSITKDTMRDITLYYCLSIFSWIIFKESYLLD